MLITGCTTPQLLKHKKIVDPYRAPNIFTKSGGLLLHRQVNPNPRVRSSGSIRLSRSEVEGLRIITVISRRVHSFYLFVPICQNRLPNIKAMMMVKM